MFYRGDSKPCAFKLPTDYSNGVFHLCKLFSLIEKDRFLFGTTLNCDNKRG